MQIYHNGTKPNQISPSQRGYRDGWRQSSNIPYQQGSWGYHEWWAAFNQGVRDYRDRYKQGTK